MSEYRCANGHLMKPSDGLICKICGGRVHTEDGLTNSQIRRKEKYEREHQEDEEEDEEEQN